MVVIARAMSIRQYNDHVSDKSLDLLDTRESIEICFILSLFFLSMEEYL